MRSSTPRERATTATTAATTRDRTPRRSALLVATAMIASATVTVAALAPATAATAAPVVYNGAGSAARIGIVGDSAFAGIRVANAFAPLRSYNFRYDAESCRRTATASCSIGGSAPPNTLTTLRQSSGQWGSVLVIATGYNDPGTTFASAVDAVMAEASRQGIRTVIWVTMRTAPVHHVSTSFRSTSSSFRDNNLILLQKARQYGGRLQIADWATHSQHQGHWFYSDGIHMRPAGADAAARFITSSAQRVLGGQSITPGVAPPDARQPEWTFLRYTMGGIAVAELQQALVAAGIHVAGGVSGVFDIGTVYAVQTFQRRHGLHPNGIVDEQTARLLGLLGGWSIFGLGARGVSVGRVQQALINAGIHVAGGVTNVFDVWTFYAVQTFQRWQGLRVTGAVDAHTARALGLVAGPRSGAVWNVLSLGSSGNVNIDRAQRALVDAGIYLANGFTGEFDASTFYAVRTFQRLNGLPVTGVIDVDTAKALGLFDITSQVATWRTLTFGSTGPSVVKAEQLLIAAGVHVANGVDGVFRIGDHYAVATFQGMRGLPRTGKLDMRTAVVLGMFEPLPANAPTTAALDVPLVAAAVLAASDDSEAPGATEGPDATAADPAELTSLQGFAWVDDDVDGTFDDAETAAAGITVTLRDGRDDVVATTSSDARGHFEFTAVEPGTYVVEAELSDDLEVSVLTAAERDEARRDPGVVTSDFEPTDRSGVVRTPLLTVDGVVTLDGTELDTIGLGLIPVDAATGTEPGVSEPEQSDPDTSEPAPSDPEPSDPDGSEPPASEPPVDTLPPPSDPPATEPAASPPPPSPTEPDPAPPTDPDG